MPKIFDIAVLGGTCGGFATAERCASRNADTIVISSPGTICECPLSDWAPADLFGRSGIDKSISAKCNAEKFKTVRYHNKRLDMTVERKLTSQAGFFFPAGELVNTLRKSAKQAGAKLYSSESAPKITVKDDCVHIDAGRNIIARFVIFAGGVPHDALAALKISSQIPPKKSFLASGIDIPLGKETLPDGLASSLNIVELADGMGIFFIAAKKFHLRIVSVSSSPHTAAGVLSKMLTGLTMAGIIPKKTDLSRAKGSHWYPPAGIALEQERHHTGRCLISGTAGGFAGCVTGQTLKPTVHSSLLAGDIILKAMQSDNPQNELAKFKTAWRKALSDYLRPPDTSIKMLLPLLFSNKKLLAKFTDLLLSGKKI